jgi:hypothetical protein
MPTLAVNPAATYAAVLLMSCGPKIEYGTTVQATSADGTPKHEVQCAVTYLAEPGQRAISEVINVTITSHVNPVDGLAIPCPVELVDLRVGWSLPQARENGRVSGGKPWYQASGMRSSLHSGRQVKAEAS